MPPSPHYFLAVLSDVEEYLSPTETVDILASAPSFRIHPCDYGQAEIPKCTPKQCSRQCVSNTKAAMWLDSEGLMYALMERLSEGHGMRAVAFHDSHH